MIIVNRSGLISCWPCDIFTQTEPPLTDTSHPEWWRPFRLSEIPFVFPPLKKTLAAASAATLLYIYGQSSVHSLPSFFLKNDKFVIRFNRNSCGRDPSCQMTSQVTHDTLTHRPHTHTRTDAVAHVKRRRFHVFGLIISDIYVLLLQIHSFRWFLINAIFIFVFISSLWKCRCAFGGISGTRGAITAPLMDQPSY